MGETGTSLEEARGHYRAGRFGDAALLFRAVLQTDPANFEALHALGMISYRTGQFERAQYFLGEALRLAPDSLECLLIRGVALMQLKRTPAALDCFARALAVNPDFVEGHVNRATALLELGRTEEALAGFDRVVALDPKNAIGWNNRGNALIKLQRYEEAAVCYERALEIAPDLTTARDNRFLVLLQLKRVSRIPDHALTALFDEAAGKYDDLMLNQLHYRGHLNVRELAGEVLPRRSGWRILDLGCGTGLVGAAFKDLAEGGRLDGLDVAPKMIETARVRGIYDGLILGDLETVLIQDGPMYDLIVSADTMIYLGDLQPTFRGVAHRLERGGFYVFACEAKDGEGWEQTAANRFRHSESYLRTEAARFGLEFVTIKPGVLRYEDGAPVAGFAAAVKKP
jgi:predicted TPR repeat methyltransferase